MISPEVFAETNRLIREQRKATLDAWDEGFDETLFEALRRIIKGK